MGVTTATNTGVNFFIAQTMPHLPGADEKLLRQTIHNVVNEFYKETNSWDVTVDVSGTVVPAGDTEIDFISNVNAATGATYARIHRIPVMWVDTIPVFGTNRPNLSNNTGGYITKIDRNTKFFMSSPGKITFSPRIKTAYTPTTWTVTCILVPVVSTANSPMTLSPTQNDNELPVLSYTEHADALVHGILHKMMLQPKKPYSDVLMGNTYGKMFANDKAYHREEARKKFSHKPRDVTMFPFFA